MNVVIPKVYREFLLAGHEMEFDDGILYDIDTIAERYVHLNLQSMLRNLFQSAMIMATMSL